MWGGQRHIKQLVDDKEALSAQLEAGKAQQQRLRKQLQLERSTGMSWYDCEPGPVAASPSVFRVSAPSPLSLVFACRDNVKLLIVTAMQANQMAHSKRRVGEEQGNAATHVIRACLPDAQSRI